MGACNGVGFLPHTYVASDELVLGEEAVIRWLILSEVVAEREELLQAISDNFQAG